MPKVRVQILLIVLLSLAVYFPVVSAEVNQVDDLVMFRALERVARLDLKSIFLPGGGDGLYYRPLIVLSSHLDKLLWRLDSGIMRLENIFLHIANALLVFSLSREILAIQQKRSDRLPFIAALIFALHPVNVESVSWISGRTDVLACCFVLSGTIALVRYLKMKKLLYLALSLVLYSLAVLTKESALGFLLGSVFILMAFKKIEHSGEASDKGYVKFFALLSVVAVVAIFFIFRHAAFTSNKSNIGMTLQYIFINPQYSLLLVLRTFAFYLKKIFAPFPLNFMITEIDPLYELLALPLLVITGIAAWRRTMISAFWITGIGLLIPSFVIIFGRIAWTPFAERYVYMGTAFIVPAVVFYVGGLDARFHTNPLTVSFGSISHEINFRFLSSALFFAVICVFLAGTLQRNMVWRTNLALYRDSAEKNPDYNEARSQYGVALFKIGDLRGAERELALARSLYSFEYFDKFDTNYSVVLIESGRYQEAISVSEKVLAKTKGKSVKALENLIDARLKQLQEAKNTTEKTLIRKKMLGNVEALAALTSDPSALYFLAKIPLVAGDSSLAVEIFKKAYAGFDRNDPYRSFAQKHLLRLGVSRSALFS